MLKLKSALLAMLSICVISFADERSQNKLPQLIVSNIQVKKSYLTDGGFLRVARQSSTWGRVIQVIDDNNMLVGIDNGRERNQPRYATIVWCKFKTTGIVDGKTGFFRSIIKTDKVTVSGTKTYRTIAGRSRTVYVFEPYKKN